MNTQDEELQRKIEEGDRFDSSVDAESYRRIFSALDREPEFTVSLSFADKVIKNIELQKAKKESSSDIWWLIGGLAVFLIGVVVAFVLLDFKPDAGIYTFISGYRSLVFFGIAFAFLLNFIDKKFIRPASL